MKVNALLMDLKDNVVTCTCEIGAGEKVCYMESGKPIEITAKEKIPYCHKMAIRVITCGENVIKYGEIIGAATSDIIEGGWVSHLNIKSLPRDYENEFIKIEK